MNWAYWRRRWKTFFSNQVPCAMKGCGRPRWHGVSYFCAVHHKRNPL